MRKPSDLTSAVLAALILAACTPRAPIAVAVPDVAAATATSAADSLYDPSRDLGTLFHDVQMSAVFPDSKTFVYSRPLDAPAALVARYAAEKNGGGFDLMAFV